MLAVRAGLPPVENIYEAFSTGITLAQVLALGVIRNCVLILEGTGFPAMHWEKNQSGDWSNGKVTHNSERQHREGLETRKEGSEHRYAQY